MNRLCIALLFGLFCAVGPIRADTRYVTDQSEIMMRKGESINHKILRMLPSGEKVTELKVNKRTGYSQVQTQDGAIGYVLTRQLQSQPVARERVAELQSRLEQLQQAPDQLSSQLAQLQSTHAALKADYVEVERQKRAIEEELASIRHASENVVEITRERSELRQKTSQLMRQIADLQTENGELRNRTTQRWFLLGAGVVVGGILIGLVLPRLHLGRRKSSWGSF